jgi:hypothetical protein
VLVLLARSGGAGGPPGGRGPGGRRPGYADYYADANDMQVAREARMMERAMMGMPFEGSDYDSDEDS